MWVRKGSNSPRSRGGVIYQVCPRSFADSNGVRCVGPERVPCAFNPAEQAADDALPAGMAVAALLDDSGAHAAVIDGAHLRFESFDVHFARLA